MSDFELDFMMISFEPLPQNQSLRVKNLSKFQLLQPSIAKDNNSLSLRKAVGSTRGCCLLWRPVSFPWLISLVYAVTGHGCHSSLYCNLH